jgi:hypothetical protein
MMSLMSKPVAMKSPTEKPKDMMTFSLYPIPHGAWMIKSEINYQAETNCKRSKIVPSLRHVGSAASGCGVRNCFVQKSC